MTESTSYYFTPLYREDTDPFVLIFLDITKTPEMEALEELRNNIMFYLGMILFAVSWIILSMIFNYRAKLLEICTNNGTLMDLIWTIIPALTLVLIAFPFFKLLYLLDEVIDPSLVIYGEGHQWYWTYEYPDFNADPEFGYILFQDRDPGDITMGEASYTSPAVSSPHPGTSSTFPELSSYSSWKHWRDNAPENWANSCSAADMFVGNHNKFLTEICNRELHGENKVQFDGLKVQIEGIISKIYITKEQITHILDTDPAANDITKERVNIGWRHAVLKNNVDHVNYLKKLLNKSNANFTEQEQNIISQTRSSWLSYRSNYLSDKKDHQFLLRVDYNSFLK